MKVRGDRVFFWILALVVFLIVPVLASPAETPSGDVFFQSVPDSREFSRVTGADTAITNLLSWRLRNNASIPAPQVAGQVSAKSVYNHFFEIAFSEMNYELLRQEIKNRPVIISSFGSFSSDDKTVVEDFIRNFNHVSGSLKISPYVKTNELGADFWINMFPEKTLHQLSNDIHGQGQVDYTEYEGSVLSDTILYQAHTRYQALDPGLQVFVNNDLTGDKRQHYILRAMTYCLGLTGEATDPSSFFYPGNTEQVNLSETDWRAIRLMYGPVMARNLTIGDAMGRLY